MWDLLLIEQLDLGHTDIGPGPGGLLGLEAGWPRGPTDLETLRAWRPCRSGGPVGMEA